MDLPDEKGKSDSPVQNGYASSPRLRVGCAGWNIPKEYADRFPAEGTNLKRYAQVFPTVEINSSFYRPHKPTTYERWAESVPDGFRFAVKVPRTITHFRRLKRVGDELDGFLAECGHLGPKLGPLLVQLPPTLAFDPEIAHDFFQGLRKQFKGQVACEPRHITWFEPDTSAFLADFDVARVAADPAIIPEAADPAGADNFVYYRLHGSPRIYYSAYTANFLENIKQKLNQAITSGADAWCIFDNTAEGAAYEDALAVLSNFTL